MSAAFPPYRDPGQAREWLKRRLEWEALLFALRAAQRGEVPVADRDVREPAAA